MSGIYIHIPFCKQACHYCDFHFSTSLKKKGELVEALAKELVLRKDEFQNKTVETIYLGGGTPSLLTIDELRLLIDSIYDNYTVSEDPEITLEANPDDLASTPLSNRDVVRGFKDIGINRLSIGIQSFFEDDLKSMNRAHNAQEAQSCLEEATKHFDNITIDLIYGIPNISLDKWNDNLQKAFGFGVNHISAYALTVEPKTALANFIKKGTYPPVDEALAEQHFQHLITETEKQGFVQYEISNFGKPDFFSRHNSSYWQGKRYLGIGPSAHSFNGTQRSWNVANNTKYIKEIEVDNLPSTVETLSLEDRYNEYVMTGLRTVWGISTEKIDRDLGTSYKTYLIEQAQPFLENGLLQLEKNKLFITKKGKFLADGIASELFFINLE